MLHNLYANSIAYFTSLLNRIFFSSSFPSIWKMAVIIPILKPLKGPILPLSYRPISLLSLLSKILEKLTNKRLVWFLESNKILSNSQYGCRKARSALMALSDLDSQIYEAEANHANLYSMFFDMETPSHVSRPITFVPFFTNSASVAPFHFYFKTTYRNAPFTSVPPTTTLPLMSRKMAFPRAPPSVAPFSY